MIKKLSLIGGLMIMLSLSSLYAFEIPFLNNNGKTEFILATNEAEVSYTWGGGFSGSYKLFSLSNANIGFNVVFELMDGIIFSNTVITMIGAFNNEVVSNRMSVYEEGDWNVMYELPNILVDVYIDNKKVSQASLFEIRFINLDEKLFNNKMRFEDGFNNKLTYELPDKYKEIIYKKIMIYQRKKEEAKKQYEAKRRNMDEEFYKSLGY